MEEPAIRLSSLTVDSGTGSVGIKSTERLAKFRELQESVASQRYNILANLTEEQLSTWPLARKYLYKFVSSQKFEEAMGVVILCNLVVIMWEADYRAQCYPNWDQNGKAVEGDCPFDPSEVPWVIACNRGFLILYTLEAGIRLYVERALYFRTRWNILDFIVVCAGYVALIPTLSFNVSWLRIFRIMRLMRAARIVLSIRELYLLLTGLLSSLKAILFGTVLLGAMLVLWSIVLVELVHPENAQIQFPNCPRCSEGFKSISASTLTLFQTVVAGDSWGAIAVPLIEYAPWTGFFLVAVVISVSLGAMNLILAVIVESAGEARERDLQNKARERNKAQEQARKELMDLFRHLDTDGSGTIDMREMKEACVHSETFRRLLFQLDIREQDMGALFSILDEDGNGEVNYKEFCRNIMDLQNSQWRMSMGMTRHYMVEVVEELNSRLDGIQKLVERQTHASETMDAKLNRLCGTGSEDSNHNISYLSTDSRGTLLAGKSARGSELVPPFASAAARFEPDLEHFSSFQELLVAELDTVKQHMAGLELLNSRVASSVSEQTISLHRQTRLLESACKAVPEVLAEHQDKPDSTQQLTELKRFCEQKRLSILTAELEQAAARQRRELASGEQFLESFLAALGLDSTETSERRRGRLAAKIGALEKSALPDGSRTKCRL